MAKRRRSTPKKQVVKKRPVKADAPARRVVWLPPAPSPAPVSDAALRRGGDARKAANPKKPEPPASRTVWVPAAPVTIPKGTAAVREAMRGLRVHQQALAVADELARRGAALSKEERACLELFVTPRYVQRWLADDQQEWALETWYGNNSGDVTIRRRVASRQAWALVHDVTVHGGYEVDGDLLDSVTWQGARAWCFVCDRETCDGTRYALRRVEQVRRETPDDGLPF